MKKIDFCDGMNNINEVFNPMVSIVIPVYNGSNYMRQAIDSALNQDYKNIEVIVINDGSDDNGLTDEIARSYGNLISYYKKENGGVASALNYGICKMKGDYFSWLSHDDMYTKDKVSKQIEVLRHLKDKTEIVNCSFAVVDEQGNYLYSDDSSEKYSIEELERPLFALFMGAINGCSLLIHKSHFERVGMFDPNLPSTQDYDLWFRMLRKQPFHQLKGEYVWSRSHEDQDSKKLIDTHVEECSDLWIKMISELPEEEMRMALGTGGKLEFYIRIRDFLRDNRGYQRALEYVNYKVLNELKAMALNQREKGAFIKLANETQLNIGFVKSLMDFPMDIYKKRLAIILGDVSCGGGLNRVNLAIASELTKKYDVFLICSENTGEGGGYEINRNIKQIRIPNRYFDEQILAKIMFLLSIDIYIESYNCDKMFLNLLNATKIYGIKSIAWYHESYFTAYMNESLQNCIPFKLKCLGKADAVVWLTNFSASIYSSLEKNGVVIPNPVTLKNEKKEVSNGKNKNIVACGRFDEPRKGFRYLLETFSIVLKQVPDAHLYIVGSCDVNQEVPGMSLTYRQFMKKLKLTEKNVHIEGWKNDVEKYIKNSRVHMLPTQYEGFGLVITECASYGVPSIVFDGCGLDDIIDHNKNGFICPRFDVKKMAEYTVELLENDKMWKEFQKGALEISEKFDIGKTISKWELLIETILTESGDLNKLTDICVNERRPEELLRQCIFEYEKAISQLCTPKTQTIVIDKTQEIETLYKEIEQLRAGYNQVTHSFSWKITEPLRWVRKLF